MLIYSLLFIGCGLFSSGPEQPPTKPEAKAEEASETDAKTETKNDTGKAEKEASE